jgi:type VI secretion system protein ImpH
MPLIDAIASAPHQWDFFHALRCIEAQHPRQPRLGAARRPGDEPVRLAQAVELTFAGSAIAAVERTRPDGVPRIQVRFFGLFGPNGPLPLHLTSYARERLLHKGDATLAHFADMFHHRLLLLFYRAWAQAQPAASFDRPAEDRFADFVGSFIGTGGPEWRSRDAVPHEAKLAYAGLLSRQVRTADGLQALLSGYLRVPVRLEPFVGRWMRLLPQERTRIGRRVASRRSSTAQLGVSAVLGGAVFDRQHHIGLHIGPLDFATFNSLLPSGSALPALQALVRQYLGQELGWDLTLELAASQRPDSRLGRQSRLGWTTWLGPPRGGAPAVMTLSPEARQASH